MSTSAGTARARFLAMFALVVAGELIFALPFHVPRYFRASMLASFDLSNAGLGDVFAVYGVTAMLAYFPGGALADRLPARGLLVASLLATALGGVYLATLPGEGGLALLYGYWGVTTILLFWAAMIRSTREWGGATAQGRAFGILDGGRGLAAATFATLAVACFSRYAGGAPGVALDDEARREAMRAVIVYYTLATTLAALLVWRCVPRGDGSDGGARARLQWTSLLAVLRMKAVWLQALVVVAAYCGYKGLDNYALYAHQVLGFSETAAAGLGAASAYIRPLAALGAGPRRRSHRHRAQRSTVVPGLGGGLRPARRADTDARHARHHLRQPVAELRGGVRAARRVFRAARGSSRAATLDRQRGRRGIGDRLHAGYLLRRGQRPTARCRAGPGRTSALLHPVGAGGYHRRRRGRGPGAHARRHERRLNSHSSQCSGEPWVNSQTNSRW
jgi:MFS family permease